jgi:nucleoside-diphosphate-sugar epimerase
MSTVLVTGAAGNVGRRVTTALLARRSVEAVLAVDRAPMPAPPAGVEVHSLDLAAPGAPEQLAALAKGASSFVHLAWQPGGKSNLSVLRGVLEAAAAVEPAQVVHMSSATVYGAHPDNPVPLTEEMAPRPNPELPYAVEKLAAEVLVGQWAKEHPATSVVVLRPACTVGTAGHPVYGALAACHRPPIGAEGRMVQYLHVDDLAAAVAHAVEQGLSGTYNVAPDGGIREDFAGSLAGGPAMLPLPRALRAAAEQVRLHTWPRRTTRGTRPYMEHSWVVSADKLSLTGWRPNYSSEQALVVSDGRLHWDELPHSRRLQVVAAGLAVTALGALAGGTVLWRRRRQEPL